MGSEKAHASREWPPKSPTHFVPKKVRVPASNIWLSVILPAAQRAVVSVAVEIEHSRTTKVALFPTSFAGIGLKILGGQPTCQGVAANP